MGDDLELRNQILFAKQRCNIGTGVQLAPANPDSLRRGPPPRSGDTTQRTRPPSSPAAVPAPPRDRAVADPGSRDQRQGGNPPPASRRSRRRGSRPTRCPGPRGLTKIQAGPFATRAAAAAAGGQVKAAVGGLAVRHHGALSCLRFRSCRNFPPRCSTQYREIKARHPDAILFFRMGDFYEMFYEDADTAARVAEHHPRPSRGDGVPLAGVPVKAAADYLAPARRRRASASPSANRSRIPAPPSGIVKRAVVETVTPGRLPRRPWTPDRATTGWWRCLPDGERGRPRGDRPLDRRIPA